MSSPHEATSPSSAGAPDWLEAEPESVRDKFQAETANAVNSLMEILHSSCSSRRSSKPRFRVEQVQMRVSSRHLTLASPTFRASLGSDAYPEGWALRSEGHLVIPLCDEDPDAMIILLSIIHGLSSKVPRRVDLDMLSKIAIAVNHRRMHEAVGIWPDTWMEKLKMTRGYHTAIRRIHFSHGCLSSGCLEKQKDSAIYLEY
ncbi:hypothetical protein ONS95_006978 [Cadophora gregata]|uniref:uncharacterized protein n=1 Tax=Cadophora gregata TaxID=51156 RepID=UPI0026DBCD05|nr:uncharacterized protein ONS95_006978 [Cadophora gregata]KAK0101829.1 hypothetical protein ONS95_006978 [Cadophora gregata]KAK0106153.1 hypothetical protein ONS96_003801 [Cadophora gregata f. sp. sojae]